MKTIGSKKNRGFTIVELMIVVAIIGVVVAAGIPAVTSFRGDNLSERAAKGVAQHIRGLTGLARSTNRAITVRIIPGNVSAAGTNGVIQASMSPDNLCRALAVGGTPALGYSMNAAFPNDQINIVRATPLTGANLDFCIKPSGKIVNTANFGPLASNATRTDCSGETPTETSRLYSQWCGQSGTAANQMAGIGCMRIAVLNPDANQTPCPGVTGDSVNHIGPDYVVRIGYSGTVRAAVITQ